MWIGIVFACKLLENKVTATIRGLEYRVMARLAGYIFSQVVPGDAISSDSSGGWNLVVRGGVFIVILLIFVFVCGYAWRKIPALRALIPEFRPGHSSLEARIREKRQREAAELQTRLERVPKTPVAPDAATPAQSSLLTSNLIALTPLAKPETEEEAALAQIYGSDRRVETAIADGTPGAVVHAASDLAGSIHHAPIVIVKREDDDKPNS